MINSRQALEMEVKITFLSLLVRNKKTRGVLVYMHVYTYVNGNKKSLYSLIHSFPFH